VVYIGQIMVVLVFRAFEGGYAGRTLAVYGSDRVNSNKIRNYGGNIICSKKAAVFVPGRYVYFMEELF